jgi:4-carboxymuconolactone decarboxylase
VNTAPTFTLPSLGRFAEIPADSMSVNQAEIARAFSSRRGTVPAPFRIFLSSAPLASRLMALSDYILRNGLLSQCEVETAVLVAAERLNATFVRAAHRKIAASAGIALDKIEAILAGRNPDFADTRQQAVYECSIAMLDRCQDDGKYTRITSVLGHDGVVEVAAILGFYATCAFTLGFYEVPPPLSASSAATG